MPIGQAAVLSVARGIGVRPGFQTAPVVPGGDGDGVDPVHDAFVMRRRAIRIGHGKGVGVGNRRDDRCAIGVAGRKGGGRDQRLSPGAALVGQVAENPQQRPSARQCLQPGRNRLGGGIDRIRAHRITHVEQQMHDQHGTGRRVQQRSRHDVHRPAAQPGNRRAGVGERQQLVAGGVDGAPVRRRSPARRATAPGRSSPDACCLCEIRRPCAPTWRQNSPRRRRTVPPRPSAPARRGH